MQLVFSSHKRSILSKMIMWFTDSDISHVSIRFGKLEANWMVEAARNGVQPGWWNFFAKKNEVKYAFELVNLNEAVLEQIVDECLDAMIGKRYDIFGILGFAIALGLKKLGFKNVKNIFGSKRVFFCSELVMRIAYKIEEHFKVVIFTGDPELTSPADLLKQCISNPYLKLSV